MLQSKFQLVIFMLNTKYHAAKFGFQCWSWLLFMLWTEIVRVLKVYQVTPLTETQQNKTTDAMKHSQVKSKAVLYDFYKMQWLMSCHNNFLMVKMRQMQ